MLDFIRNLKLKDKIFLACISLILLFSLVSMLSLYSYVTNQIRETADINSADMLGQVSNAFDEKLKGIFRRAFALQINDSLNRNLSQFLFNDEEYRYPLALSQLSVSFSEIRSTENFISSLSMYTPKGGFYDLSRIKNPGFDFNHWHYFQQFQKTPSQTVFWGTSCPDEIYSGAKIVIPLMMRFTIEGYNGDIILVVNLDHDQMLNYLNHIYSEEGNWVLVLDNNGKELMSNADPITQKFLADSETIKKVSTHSQGSLRHKYGKENYLISYYGMTTAPWKIVNIKSERVLLQKVNSFGIFLLVFTAVSTIICLIFALILANSITRPLALLENAIKKVTQRDFDVKFDYNYRDEVGQLGNSFNFMVEEIKDLIRKLSEYIAQLKEEKEKVRNEQRLKRRAELKALQAQINPHFLYNTLDSIRWMAEKIEATNISRITIALSTLFRTGLNKGQEFVSLQDELENINSYLTIQKMRYGDQFNYTIAVDEGLKQLVTIKLILQPIVENAIYHGIKEKEGIGLITIRGAMVKDSNDIELIVQDNGLGIHPIKLALIDQKLEEGLSAEYTFKENEGYGVFNVQERLRLYFGKPYGVKFDSELGKGTEVRILIPAITKEEAGKYV